MHQTLFIITAQITHGMGGNPNTIVVKTLLGSMIHCKVLQVLRVQLLLRVQQVMHKVFRVLLVLVVKVFKEHLEQVVLKVKLVTHREQQVLKEHQSKDKLVLEHRVQAGNAQGLQGPSRCFRGLKGSASLNGNIWELLNI